MVENSDKRTRRALYTRAVGADWAALYERWRKGEPPERLALAYGLSPVTVAERCRWIDALLKTDTPARLRLELEGKLQLARTALSDGDPVKAEREAKAVAALVRAAQALERWSGGPQAAAIAAEEVRGERDEPDAELEKRVLAEFERRERVAAAEAAQSAAKTGDLDGSPTVAAEGA